MQCTDEEVAAFFGVSTRTIERRRKVKKFSEAMDRAKAKGRVSVRRSLFKLAATSRFHLGQFAYIAKRLNAMPEGEGTVLDNSRLMFLSNIWAGWKHDNMKLPVVLAEGLGGALQTRRALDSLYDGDE